MVIRAERQSSLIASGEPPVAVIDDMVHLGYPVLSDLPAADASVLE